jgi:hypothetical protein
MLSFTTVFEGMEIPGAVIALPDDSNAVGIVKTGGKSGIVLSIYAVLNLSVK